MTNGSVLKTLKIANEKGLHARAAAMFVKTADSFDADIHVVKDGQNVSGHSILGLMMLGAACNSEITVICDGTQAAEAADALERLVNDKFNED